MNNFKFVQMADCSKAALNDFSLVKGFDQIINKDVFTAYTCGTINPQDLFSAIENYGKAVASNVASNVSEKVADLSSYALTAYNYVQQVSTSSMDVALRASTDVVAGANDSASCVTNELCDISNVLTAYNYGQQVSTSATDVALRASTDVVAVANDAVDYVANELCDVSKAVVPYVAPEAYSNTTIALGVAAGAAALFGMYSLYNYLNQPVKPEPEAEPVKKVTFASQVEEFTHNEVETVVPGKPVVSALELNLERLNRAEKALLAQALGSVEVSKIQSAIDSTRDIMKNIASEKDVDPVVVKMLVEGVKSELAAVSYEGKGVIEADKAEVSYLKRAVIAVTEALQYVLSFVGQFMSSEEKNPAAEALIGRSFFLSAPMTAREVDAIEKAQADVLDTVAVVSPAA